MYIDGVLVVRGNEFHSSSGKQGVRWTLEAVEDRVIIHTLFAALSSLSFRERVRQLGWRMRQTRGCHTLKGLR
jgi:hypothetical protein